MNILNAIISLLFLPGTLALQFLGISIEEDSGILRSLLNSCFWGAITLGIALKIWI